MMRRLLILFLVAMLAFPLIGQTDEGDHDDDDEPATKCLAKEASSCASCHEDSQKRYASNHHRPCTPYCMGCHKKAEMERHHTVGSKLSRDAREPLYLTSKKQISCATCHDLSKPRHDKVRWKASSLYDRMFRKESRHKTYYLTKRNDIGQLCLTCH